jgi:diphthine synthase
LSGLQSYRFGRQVTIPYQYGDYLPVSPLEMIVGNQMNNLHTLVLLDLDPTGMGVDAPIPMSPKQAFTTVMEMAERIGDREDDFPESLGSHIPEWDCILLSDIGTSDQRLVSGPFSEISNVAGGRIHCLIFPASFSGMEQDAFEHHKADT